MSDIKPARIVVAFDPSFTPGSGAASTAYWRGSARPALDAMFAVRPDETIAGIVVDEQGITAYFRSVRGVERRMADERDSAK